MTVKKPTRRPSQLPGFSPTLTVTWSAQMLDVQAAGGMLDRWGAELNTITQRVGLAAGAYADGVAALRSAKADRLLDHASLWGKLDAAMERFFDAAILELSDDEIAGFAAFLLNLQLAVAKRKAVREVGKP